MKTKVNTARTRLLAVSIALATAMGAALTANAGTVRTTVKVTRYATTGCKYENSFSTGGSIGIWVKSITSYDSLVSIFGSCHVNSSAFGSEQGLLLFLNGNQNFGFRVAGSKNGSVARNDIVAASSSSKLNDGSWHFLMGTFDKSSCKMYLYIDGVQAGTADIDVDSIVSTRCFTINKMGTTTEGSSGGSDNYGAGCVGLYAEATLWNKALSASEVATLYTRRAMPEDDGLIGYWPMAKNGGNLARNAALRNNDSRPGMYYYYQEAVVDEDFFNDPPTHFVASEEWVAANNYVQPAGATFTTPDDPATNVADAVSAAAAGNIVYLVPGTHSITSQVDITKAKLTITGRYCGNDVGEAVIDAHRLCRHFRSHYNHSGQDGFTIDGITFRNGLPSGSDVDDQRGGSLLVRNKSGTVCNCRFFGNESTYAGGAIWAQQGDAVISNSVFGGNICSGIGQGGAVFAIGAGISIVDCVITNNSAVQGGGVYAQSVTIDGCHFEGNLVGSADDDRRGGNILVDANAKVMNSKFTGTCSAKRGACLGFMGTGAVVSNCVFSGLAPSGSYGVMQFTYTAAQSTFADCVFTNMAFNSALFFPQNSSVSILIRQCLFGENSGTAAIISDRGGKLRFENCTIAASKFDSKDSDSGQNVLVNCIAPYADITSSGAFVNIVTNSLVKSVSGGTQDSRVMTGDPKFVDAANGDYRLFATSPCREKGLVLDWMTAGATDLDGNPRLANLLGKAAADALPDLGCYECQEKGLVPTVIIIR